MGSRRDLCHAAQDCDVLRVIGELVVADQAAVGLAAKLTAMADAGETLAGRKIVEAITVNGARLMLENGAWGLVRASSNTPNLVVVCESPESEAEMRAIFEDLDAIIRTEPTVGEYDQKI